MTRQEAKELALKHCKPIHLPFDRWIFPVIQNISPQSLAEALVSVQPMDGPVLVGRRGEQNLEAGYVYAPYIPLYLDFVYDSKWERFKRFVKGLLNWRHWLRVLRRRHLCYACLR